MALELTSIEARVIGSLIEKERTTPDNYPLSTNALAAACSQKTSRDPVMEVSEREVDAAMLGLREKGLARSLKPSGSRAWKHRQVVNEVLSIDDRELTVLAVLLLRGPQTPGELRSRTDRIADFGSVDEVEATLMGLSQRSTPLARNTGRGPGQSQDRWEHDIPIEGVRSTGLGERPGRGEEFRRLHESGLFIMPNPWDLGSALRLQAHGFPALATTSAGYARSIGKEDQEVTREELVRHVADLTDVLQVPLNVDSERLFALDPGGIGESVRLLATAGAAGCSIEDYDPVTGSIESVDRCADAVSAAATACADHGLVLTARAENHLYGVDDLDDTVARLQAYERAGADVLYAPGLSTLLDVELVVGEVTAPVNVLARPDGPTTHELEDAGVRRVSIGGALYNAAYRMIDTAATELLGPGTSGYAS